MEELFSTIFSMLPDTPNLICLPTEERADDKAGRVAAKVLVASVMRNLPVAEVKVLRGSRVIAFQTRDGCPTHTDLRRQLSYRDTLPLSFFSQEKNDHAFDRGKLGRARHPA